VPAVASTRTFSHDSPFTVTPSNYISVVRRGI
jgi:hypothetical protein